MFRILLYFYFYFYCKNLYSLLILKIYYLSDILKNIVIENIYIFRLITIISLNIIILFILYNIIYNIIEKIYIYILHYLDINEKYYEDHNITKISFLLHVFLIVLLVLPSLVILLRDMSKTITINDAPIIILGYLFHGTLRYFILSIIVFIVILLGIFFVLPYFLIKKITESDIIKNKLLLEKKVEQFKLLDESIMENLRIIITIQNLFFFQVLDSFSTIKRFSFFLFLWFGISVEKGKTKKKDIIKMFFSSYNTISKFFIRKIKLNKILIVYYSFLFYFRNLQVYLVFNFIWLSGDLRVILYYACFNIFFFFFSKMGTYFYNKLLSERKLVEELKELDEIYQEYYNILDRSVQYLTVNGPFLIRYSHKIFLTIFFFQVLLWLSGAAKFLIITYHIDFLSYMS